jgi:Rrf2 family protein
MYVTAKLDYGLRALVVLASQTEGTTLRAHDIAGRNKLPLPYVAAILAELRRAGIVANRRGSSGGYRLARPASEISVADVVAALRVWPVDVHPVRIEGQDPLMDRLTVVWRQLRDTTENYLASVTLAELVSPAASHHG